MELSVDFSQVYIKIIISGFSFKVFKNVKNLQYFCLNFLYLRSLLLNY